MSKGEKMSIELVGGPPWGFRLGGGSDFGCPLEIAKLRKNSKATKAGLAEGDVVTVIDHQNVASKSHGDAMKIIELAGPTLRLDIIKGVGPSADLMNTSMMSDSMTLTQSDATDASQHQSRPAELRRQEPHKTIASTQSPPRRSSTPRTLTIIPTAPIHKEEAKKPEIKPAAPAEPWTVNVTSYEFANKADTIGKSQTLRVHPRQPPPTSPKPKFKANTLPRKSATDKSSCPVLPSWDAPPPNPTLQHVWNPAEQTVDSNANEQFKAAPMFKVAKVDAKLQKWQPTSMKNIAYDDPRHKFNSDEMNDNTHQSPAMTRSYEQPNHVMSHSPAPPMQHIPEPPPPPPPMSPKKPANHIPGMVNPLICDDSQGDFGANPLVRPNIGGEGSKSKKIYADSAFYDSPMMSYPTIQEQVALAREISNFLESNQNKRSRGGRMFTKRKQRAEEWTMNSQGQRKDIQQVVKFESLQSGMPAFSMQKKEFGYNQVRHHPDPIKSKLDAAELEQIQHNQDSLCKHDSLPPNIAFDINQALATSHGKAGQFFEKRKQRAEKYVVDENNRRNWHPQSMALHSQLQPPESPQPMATRPYKSPWEAAAEGQLDSAFQEMSHSPNFQQPSPSGQVYQPLNVITNHQDVSKPQLNIKYKSFKPVNPVHAARAPLATNSLPKQKTRLEMMLEGSAPQPAPQTNGSAIGTPNSYSREVNNTQPVSPSPSNLSYSQSSVYSSVAPVALVRQPSSATTTSLRRPKDYLNQTTAMTQPQNTSVSAF